MISNVPRVVQPIPKVSPTRHKISIFSRLIAEIEVSKCFQTPSMKPYDGTTYPEEHMAQIKSKDGNHSHSIAPKRGLFMHGFWLNPYRISLEVASQCSSLFHYFF